MLKIKDFSLKYLLLSAALAGIGYAQTTTFTSMSMASYGPVVSPDSIVAGFGTNLATATTTAASLPLLTTLGNVQISIVDSTGVKVAAPLYMVSPAQINYLVPATVALGKATVTVTAGSATFTGPLSVSNIAPAIATANNDGKGVPAAQVLRVTAAGVTSVAPTFMGAATAFTPSPIDLSTAPTDKVYLMLYGTGFRRHSLNPVKATIAGISVPVLYAATQSQYPGLDQVNIGPLPQTLVGMAQANFVITADGVPANTVALAFK